MPYRQTGIVLRCGVRRPARIPEEARNWLAALAAAVGMSLRAYLVQLADTLLALDGCAARAEQTRAALKECNGCAPTQAEEGDPYGEPDRRLAQAGPPRTTPRWPRPGNVLAPPHPPRAC